MLLVNVPVVIVKSPVSCLVVSLPTAIVPEFSIESVTLISPLPTALIFPVFVSFVLPSISNSPTVSISPLLVISPVAFILAPLFKIVPPCSFVNAPDSTVNFPLF